MGDKTGIEWTDATWNPLRGCSRVSEGCRNCYAEGVANRFKGPGMPYEGLIAKGGQWNGEIKLVPEKLIEPWQWTKPRMIFVNSMSDLFHENVPFEYIATVFSIMAVTTRHTYQVLTKRPERMLEFFEWCDRRAGDLDADYEISHYIPRHLKWEPATKSRGGYDNCGPLFPYENIWLGVSVEDQQTADERIPFLLKTPAAIRWISAEPLLGPIQFDFSAINIGLEKDGYGDSAIKGGIDWIVTGGESGPKARSMESDWVRNIRDECKAFDIPFFFKQWGEYAPNWLNDDHGEMIAGSEWMDRPGKKIAGSTLDGVEHKAWPKIHTRNNNEN